ncbi:MAG: nucleotide sugar dehydrogenase, partial [Acidimicrobiales bacterium]
MTSLVVMGQGYVGLPLAMRAVEVGHSVIGYDPDPKRAKRLASSDSYVEDVSNEEIAAALATGRYKPTDRIEDLAGFDVALITVPTPLTEGIPDLSFVEAAAHTLGAHLSPGSCV